MAEGWDVYRPRGEEPRPETGAPATEPPVAEPSVAEPPAQPAPKPRPRAAQSVRRRRTWVNRRTPSVVGIVAGLVFGGYTILHRPDHPAADLRPHPRSFAPTLAHERFDRFLAELLRRTGSTEASAFQSRDGDYRVVVPPRETGGSAQTLLYTGDSGLHGAGDAPGEARTEPFDLAALDVDALGALFEKAWYDARSTPTGSSLGIHAPDGPHEAWVKILIYEYSGNVYAVDATLDGEIVSARELG